MFQGKTQIWTNILFPFVFLGSPIIVAGVQIVSMIFDPALHSHENSFAMDSPAKVNILKTCFTTFGRLATVVVNITRGLLFFSIESGFLHLDRADWTTSPPPYSPLLDLVIGTVWYWNSMTHIPGTCLDFHIMFSRGYLSLTEVKQKPLGYQSFSGARRFCLCPN